MRKVKLNLHALQVESFDTSAGAAAPDGTVHANQLSGSLRFCPGDPTQYGTCQETCQMTCAGPGCDEPTFYITCVESCSWTYGDVACLSC
jgi:hypothetical protein